MFKALLQTIEESCSKQDNPDVSFTDDDRALWIDFAAWIYSVFSERSCSAKRDPAADFEEDPAGCLPKAAKGSSRFNSSSSTETPATASTATTISDNNSGDATK